MILYIENPKVSTRKLLELINEYSKIAGYKINTWKSLAFLYTNNEKIEREIKETIPFTIAMKKIKYLGIYLPKETFAAAAAAAAAKSLQLCPTLCDPMDSSPPGSPIPLVSLGRYIPKYFILFIAMVNGIVSLIFLYFLIISV